MKRPTSESHHSPRNRDSASALSRRISVGCLASIRGKKMADTDRRLLIVDDNPAIHEDFRKILCRSSDADAALSDAEAQVFGSDANDADGPDTFEVDAAVQGDDGV